MQLMYFEPDCTIVTSVDLDHMDFLGDTREQIGAEKAGIFRKISLRSVAISIHLRHLSTTQITLVQILN
jgi:folylpolyglutamate synthase/dihydropteroate synthase